MRDFFLSTFQARVIQRSYNAPEVHFYFLPSYLLTPSNKNLLPRFLNTLEVVKPFEREVPVLALKSGSLRTGPCMIQTPVSKTSVAVTPGVSATAHLS